MYSSGVYTGCAGSICEARGELFISNEAEFSDCVLFFIIVFCCWKHRAVFYVGVAVGRIVYACSTNSDNIWIYREPVREFYRYEYLTVRWTMSVVWMWIKLDIPSLQLQSKLCKWLYFLYNVFASLNLSFEQLLICFKIFKMLEYTRKYNLNIANDYTFCNLFTLAN